MAKGRQKEANLEIRRRVLRLTLLLGVLLCAVAMWWAQENRLLSPNELRSLKTERLETLAYRGHDVAALCVLGERYLADENLDSALRAYSTARDRDPNSAAAVAGFVLVQSRSSSPGWGEMVLRELVAAQPMEPAGHLALGQLYVQNSEMDGAGEPLRRARELAPKDAEVLYHHGVWSGSIGATGQGVLDLEAACRYVPRMGRYRVALADLLIHLSKYEPAKEHLRIAEAEMPDSGVVQYHFGRISLAGKVTPEAGKEGVRRLQRALELAPGWDMPRLTLGRYYLQIGDVKRGITELEAVLQSGNQSAELLAALAQGYFRAGRRQDGNLLNRRYNELLAGRRKETEEKEAAVAPGPDRVGRMLRRAQRLQAQGRVLSALALYRQLLAEAPNHAAANRAVRELTLQTGTSIGSPRG